MHGFRPLSGAAVIFAVTAHLAAQSPQNRSGQYDAAQIAAGAIAYAAQCSACHGVNGDQIAGVDFRRGQFRTAVSDDDLKGVLANGRPGAGMPAFTVLRTDEVTALIAFIRSGLDATGSAVSIGEPGRGETIFNGRGECTSCHRVNGRGSYAATDLSDIGSVRSPVSLQRALLGGSVAPIPANRSVRVTTRDGRTIRGRRLNEDTYTIQIIDDKAQLVSLTKADLRSLEFAPASSMPSYESTLTPDERADLIAYLLSLKGQLP